MIAPNRILQIKRAFNLTDKDYYGPSNNMASNLAKNFLDQFNATSAPSPSQNPYLLPLMMPQQFMMPGMGMGMMQVMII
jgi:hypothetical protein